MNHDDTSPDRRSSDNGATGYGSTEPAPASHVGRAVHVLVYAPLGAGLSVVEAVPVVVEAFVARGKAEVDRRHEQVSHQASNARSMGQFALSFGLPKVRRRAERRVAQLRDAATRLVPMGRPAPAPVPPTSAAAKPTTAPTPVPEQRMDSAAPSLPTRVPGTARAPSATNGARAAVERAELPIPGYDALSASQVVERLAGLADSELAAVRNYEAGHRNRRTILGKIEQLESPSV